MSIRPDTRSRTAAPLPLYGTCRRSTLALALNISPNKCWMVPVPIEAYVSLRGCDLANAISSSTERAGPIINHYRLSKPLRKMLGDRARDRVDEAARPKAHDESHRAAWIPRCRALGVRWDRKPGRST